MSIMNFRENNFLLNNNNSKAKYKIYDLNKTAFNTKNTSKYNRVKKYFSNFKNL